MYVFAKYMLRCQYLVTLMKEAGADKACEFDNCGHGRWDFQVSPGAVLRAVRMSANQRLRVIRMRSSE